MSLNNFIEEIWADTMLKSLKQNLVFGSLFNGDYQGEIANMGDTVRINAIGDPTISAYTKDTALAAPQSLTDAQTMLVISQANYYNFAIDDVDAAQAHPKVMAEAMDRAAYEMALTMDGYYAGFYTDAISANLVGTSGAPITPNYASMNTTTGMGTGTGVYDYLSQLGQYLTQQKIPKKGRWCIGPPWMTTLLALDLRFTGFNTPESVAIRTENKLDASGGQASDAYIGRVAGMDLYESLSAHHVSGTSGATGSVDVFMAGHSMALSKAEGITKTEAFRPPDRFADAVKGLALYGAKTVRPYGIAVAYLQHP